MLGVCAPPQLQGHMGRGSQERQEKKRCLVHGSPENICDVCAPGSVSLREKVHDLYQIQQTIDTSGVETVG